MGSIRSSRTAVTLLALALGAAGAATGPALADPPLKQVYRRPAPVQPGSYADPYYGRQGNRICPRWCLQDRNPCDPPEYKIADGRCLWENQ
jgi:hypothetical protein